jgi:GH25 family lysozyme M1 (1,4-beta-N-acetylmuramidase)
MPQVIDLIAYGDTEILLKIQVIHPAPAPDIPPPPSPLHRGDRGVDVSHWQKEITVAEWMQAKAAGYTFAILKATEGWGGEDSRTVSNTLAARAAGMETGLYHFFRPDLRRPEDQARNFQRVIDQVAGPGFLGAWVDVEEPRDAAGVPLDPALYATTMNADLHTLMLALKATGAGAVPGIYSRRSFIQARLPSAYWLEAYDFWTAYYPYVEPTTVEGAVIRVPTHWEGANFNRVRLWQYDNARMPWSTPVPGLGNVDRDFYLG